MNLRRSQKCRRLATVRSWAFRPSNSSARAVLHRATMPMFSPLKSPYLFDEDSRLLNFPARLHRSRFSQMASTKSMLAPKRSLWEARIPFLLANPLKLFTPNSRFCLTCADRSCRNSRSRGRGFLSGGDQFRPLSSGVKPISATAVKFLCGPLKSTG